MAAPAIPIAIGATKLVGKKVLMWTGKKWVQQHAAKELAKKGLKLAVTKGKPLLSKTKTAGKEVLTNLRRRLAISGLNTPLTSLQAQRIARTNNALRPLIGSGKGFKAAGIAGKAGKLLGPAYWGMEAVKQTGKILSPGELSKVRKKPPTEKEVEDQTVVDEEAKVAVTKAETNIPVPTPVITPKTTPVTTPKITSEEEPLTIIKPSGPTAYDAKAAGGLQAWYRGGPRTLKQARADSAAYLKQSGWDKALKGVSKRDMKDIAKSFRGGYATVFTRGGTDYLHHGGRVYKKPTQGG